MKYPRSMVLFLLFVFGGVGCSGCSPIYIFRGAVEQGKILLSREPIQRVIASERVDAEQRRKLELILEARLFAANDLGMKVGDAYASYAIVPQGALVWVVSAAEKVALEPYTWWFPIVGTVTYKGFFEKADAEQAAERLREAGYDTYVRPSSAFSTLGWFDDPVLSTWLRRGEVSLVDLVLHELLHRSFYLPGETDFNESFAAWVGHAGARAFFLHRDGAEAETTRTAEKNYEASLDGSEAFDASVARLRALYAEARRESWPRAKTLEAREAIFAEFGALGTVNNAVVLARWSYRRNLREFDCFAREIRGGLGRVIEGVEARTRGADDPFAALDCADQPSQSVGDSAGRS